MARCDQYNLGFSSAVDACYGILLSHPPELAADVAAKVFVESACTILLNGGELTGDAQLDLSLPRALEACSLALDQELYKQLLVAQRTACALSTVSHESKVALHMLTRQMVCLPFPLMD